MNADRRIRWPAGLEPKSSPVFAHNELDTHATPEAVWGWLLAAPRWREFYSNCKRLRLPHGATRLTPGMRFSWWTFGVPVETTIEVFEEHRQLAWVGAGVGSRGYHVWLLDKTPSGCRIITEETQAGAVVSVIAPFMRRGLLHFHQRWLEGLSRVALAGPPE
jgi:hypothetical protein